MLRRAKPSTSAEEAGPPADAVPPEEEAPAPAAEPAGDPAAQEEKVAALAALLDEVRDTYAREIIELRARLRGMEQRLRRLERPAESGASAKAAKRERKGATRDP
jgi:hypothetical protein